MKLFKEKLSHFVTSQYEDMNQYYDEPLDLDNFQELQSVYQYQSDIKLGVELGIPLLTGLLCCGAIIFHKFEAVSDGITLDEFPVLLFLLLAVFAIPVRVALEVIPPTLDFSINLFFKLLHANLPGAADREERILTFYKIQHEQYLKDTRPGTPDRSTISDWHQLGPKDFAAKYFNKSSSNFINFLNDRTLVHGVIQENFLNFATSIPKVTEMSIDSLRKILINPVNHPILVSKEQLELIFQNYTTLQIERIFTNHLGKDRFNELQDLNKPALIYSNFILLLEGEVDNAKEISEKSQKINNLVLGDFTIKVLRTQGDYNRASDDFSNCIRSYFDADGEVLTFSKEGQPEACVYVVDQKIQEIRGFKNKESASESKVIQILSTFDIIA